MFDDIHAFDSITYEDVGIDPRAFYSGKFAGSAGRHDVLLEPCNSYDIEFDRARFLAEHVKGPAILDIGCGTAPYAGTIRNAARPRHLVGIDLDPECVRIAKTVYDDAFRFELGQRLPFADGYFNSIFSCDVFGHIEFRHKDAVIEELHRITAPGGCSAHIIECGYLDYHAMKPGDPGDPISTYVRMEGHIGVETAAALEKRWMQYFESVTITNASIYPFAPIWTYLADPALPPALRSLIEAFDERERKAVHVVLGHLVQKLRQDLSRQNPAALFPDHTSGNPLQWPSGLAYLIARKRSA